MDVDTNYRVFKIRSVFEVGQPFTIHINIITNCQWLPQVEVFFENKLEFVWPYFENMSCTLTSHYIHTLVCLLATPSSASSATLSSFCNCRLLSRLLIGRNDEKLEFFLISEVTLVWRLSTGLLSSPWWTCELVRRRPMPDEWLLLWWQCRWSKASRTSERYSTSR